MYRSTYDPNMDGVIALPQLDAAVSTFKQANHDALPNPHHSNAADHPHSNKALLDTYAQTETNLADAVSKKHAAAHDHASIYEPANANIQSHVTSAHAPSDAQKNSNILKAEIEAKLTGEISTHTHAGGGSGPSMLKKTANQTINGTAFQNITDLTFAVEANTDYAFKFYIVFRSAAIATGFRFAINGPEGATCDYFMTYQTVANATTVGVATWLQGHWVVYDTMTALTATIAANVDLVCMIEGRICVGATPGTLATRVASELADNNLTVRKGSWGLWF